jgi:hypothetical protein
MSRPIRSVRRLVARVRHEPEAGMTTAEYAVGTVAAASFAALMYTILHSSVVANALTLLITRALRML